VWGVEAPGTLGGGVEASEGGAIEGREAEDRTPLSMTVLMEIPSRIVEASDTGKCGVESDSLTDADCEAESEG
jgi:hypothetical protein